MRAIIIVLALLVSVSAEARYQKDPNEHEAGMLRAFSGLDNAIVKTATGSEEIWLAYDMSAGVGVLQETHWIPDFPYDSKAQWLSDYGYPADKVINAIYQCQMKPGTQYVEGIKPGTNKRMFYIKKNIAALNLAVCFQVAEWTDD